MNRYVVLGLAGVAAAGASFAGYHATRDDSGDKPLSAEQWCIEEGWEEGLAPIDWTKSDFIQDCTDALEGGWTRPMLIDIYSEMKEQGG